MAVLVIIKARVYCQMKGIKLDSRVQFITIMSVVELEAVVSPENNDLLVHKAQSINEI